MKFRLVTVLVIAVTLSQSLAAMTLQPQGKPTPDVTFDKVQAIFGSNLNTDNTTLKQLLLAVGMDHTSVDSPFVNEHIGIPFIVAAGPGFWVDNLKSGDTSLDVLVNNALLLLFTTEEIPGGEDKAIMLMEEAAAKGYWPADYFIADINIKEYLTDSPSDVINHYINTAEYQRIAKETMLKLNRCAEIGFAPCQYRVGFWLANSEGSLKKGLDVLRQAIHTTLNDARYQGVMNESLILAANEIVFKGDQVGIDDVIRKEYVKLIEEQLMTTKR